MRRLRLSALGLCVLGSYGISSEPTRPIKENNTAVSASMAATLDREASGMLVARREFPSGSSLETSADHWQAGEFKHGDKWSSFESLSNKGLSESLLKYEELRSETKLDESGHRVLARWCKSQKLEPQEKAHWYGVLSTAPDDLQARQALGHQRIDDRWFTREDINLANASSARLEKEWQKWMPEMRRIVVAVQSPNAKTKQAGLEKLNGIEDASAISSLELTCFQVAEDYAVPFIKAIARNRSKEACLALVRVSLAFPIDSRGDLAITELKKYPKEMYVPELLSLLSTPVKNEVECTFNAKGDMLIRSAMYRETMDEKQITRIDRLVSIVPEFHKTRGLVGVRLGSVTRLGGLVGIESGRTVIGQESLNSARKNVLENQHELASNVDALNSKAAINYKSVYHVLRQATSTSVDDTPTAWWKWWQESNERYAPRKAVRERVYEQQERTPLVVNDYHITYARMSCLVRGTLIQTSTGLTPIEKIQIGDQVMSQDVETGELALKPVLATTVRPPKSTTRLITDAGEIQATGGHRWFVAGKGWLMTNQLEVDMVLRTATGTSKIEEIIEDSKEQETYNLIVDDFHTYFVGENRVLSYDNSDPKPTLRPVPGYGQIVVK